MTYQARSLGGRPQPPSSPQHQQIHSIHRGDLQGHRGQPRSQPNQPPQNLSHNSPTRRNQGNLSSVLLPQTPAFTPQSMSHGHPLPQGLSMSQGIPVSMAQNHSLNHSTSPNLSMSQPISGGLSMSGGIPRGPKEEEEEEGEWTKLDIANKKLVAISPNIAIYTHITELYLQKNSLTRLPVELFHSLLHLRHLDLSNNQLSWLQPEICHLLQLRELNLNWNQIRELPMEMGKLFRLEKLSFDGNPLVKPTQDVLAKAGEPPPPRAWINNAKSDKSNLQPECIRVFSYNVLADAYASPERLNYCPSWALSWDYRKVHIIKEITLYEPDIICLQEVESEQYQNFFLPEMTGRGYGGEFFAKGRSRTMDSAKSKSVDGCVIFWKHDMFSVVVCERIQYQSLALQKHKLIGPDGVSRLVEKDNVALVMLLKPKGTLKINPHAEVDQILVVNTHIHWNPNAEDVKVMQVQLLLEKLEDMAKIYGSPCGAPLSMVVSGDFNSVTDSAVYNLLDQKSVSAEHPNFGIYDYGHYTKNGLKTELDLKSSYKQVSGEPAFTNYTGNFIGVLDYIWYSDATLSPERVLAPPPEDVIINQNGALPNPYLCSDHVYLVTDLYGKLHPTKSSENRLSEAPS